MVAFVMLMCFCLVASVISEEAMAKNTLKTSDWTTIKYDGQHRIKLYDVDGRLIKSVTTDRISYRVSNNDTMKVVLDNNTVVDTVYRKPVVEVILSMSPVDGDREVVDCEEFVHSLHTTDGFTIDTTDKSDIVLDIDHVGEFHIRY